VRSRVGGEAATVYDAKSSMPICERAHSRCACGHGSRRATTSPALAGQQHHGGLPGAAGQQFTSCMEHIETAAWQLLGNTNPNP
jgi:hypothetical protein